MILLVKRAVRAAFGSTRGRWISTLIATAVSTYTLDAIATISGLLVVFSGLLSGLGQASALAFLAASYVAWGAGLRTNLGANWRLLTETGTSTNAPSKLLWEISRARRMAPGWQHLAAGAGYVAAELAKESPYYAGAFGAVLITETIAAREAVIFLGAANLGAAGYEFGLAWLTRTCLDRRASRDHSSFERDWVPNDYLRDFYRTVEDDERETIAFFVRAAQLPQPAGPVLFVGVGPALHHVFAFAPGNSEIHLGDYLPSNLREIGRWLQQHPGAHDWRSFIRYTLECEGHAAVTEPEISRRAALARARISRLVELDIRRPHPLGHPLVTGYGTVVSAYCADSITADRVLWQDYMQRTIALVHPGGTFITAALGGTDAYLVGGRAFPSPNLDTRDLTAALAPWFDPSNTEVIARAAPGCAALGYSSILLAVARDRRSQPNVGCHAIAPDRALSVV